MKTTILHCPGKGVLEFAVTGKMCSDHVCDLVQITLGHIKSGLAARLVIVLPATRLNHGFSCLIFTGWLRNFSSRADMRKWLGGQSSFK